MRPLSDLSDSVVLRDLAAIDCRDRGTLVELLQYVAEVDRRRLFAPVGYSSMFAFCTGKLHWSEDVAFKRIRVARLAHRFPIILRAVGDGRVHLGAVVALAPRLTRHNVHDLLTAATHKSRRQVEQLLAERFPLPDVPARLQPLRSTVAGFQLPPGPVDPTSPGHALVPEQIDASVPESCAPILNCDPSQALTWGSPAPGRVVQARPQRNMPLSAESWALQATISSDAQDALCEIQELLGEPTASDLGAILGMAFEALRDKLRREKCAATSRPRTPRSRENPNPRYVPAHVRRAVRARDGGQCTFVSDDGHRCTERSGLELDHIEPVARGGRANVENIRLRCRAHNQLEAERVFGRAFMDDRRDVTRAQGRSFAESQWETCTPDPAGSG